ncbi:hypothetical protein PAECIP111802_01243 [Paenibacillus allorhizosphaerae]|uniref:PH domain-containing protein n=1 Tax=Paenibacillus allorhizosphaerae TaxID=2849866 RepID=A0ABM8VD43_9BACL|nr:hypothetical protein PAECIP111802_01243 [Paenibacillus allorhizosphaerae]
MMSWIVSQPYFKIERELNGLEQKIVVQCRTMYLYPDKIVTRFRTFSFDEVFDISYRHIGDKEGFLYLHTNQGVYPYIIKDNPENFIHSFNVHKNKW